MPPYDAVADRYDEHFRRPVDRWEDARLRALLSPHVNGAEVLDLGCGTGWVADHLSPARYIGIDASAPMLARLREKHPEAITMKGDLWSDDWMDGVVGGWPVETIVATWAAHEFPLVQTLRVCRNLVRPGGVIALHGQAPRYGHREHYILGDLDERQGWRRWTPGRCQVAAERSGLTWVGATGTGSLDHGPRYLWEVTARATPPGQHFAFLAVWRA